MKPWIVAPLALLACGGPPGSTSRAGAATAPALETANAELDAKFLDGLRSRHLFDLAESFCRRSLDQGEISDDRRAELVIELARTLAAHAIDSPRLEREPLWRQADESLDGFQREHPRNSQSLAIELQKALLALARGQTERQEAEIGGLQRDGLEPAKKSLRQAIALLRHLDETAKRKLIERGRAQRPEPGEWSTAQLISLQTNLRFQLARALVNQALCYLPDSSDRINALSAAREALVPLAQLAPLTPLAWESRVEEIKVYRLLRDFSAAGRKLAAALKEDPPTPFRQRLAAEEIRMALDRGDAPRATTLAGNPARHAVDDGEELNFARFEAYVAAWRASAAGKTASTSHGASTWEAAANQQARFLEQRFGAYWMRRAETLIAATIAVGPGESVETLKRAAAGYFRGGQMNEAVAAYDRAAKLLARDEKTSAESFDLALAAATIEHQQGHADEALRRYLELSLAMPDHAKADEAHLLAIYDAARVADAAAGEVKSAAFERYERLLKEHLERWPNSATRGQAAWWLGQAQERIRDWPAAAASYRLIPRTHPQFAAALAAIAHCEHELLAAGDLAPEERSRRAAKAAQEFADLAAAPDDSPTDSSKLLKRQTARFAAEFYLEAIRPSGSAAAAASPVDPPAAANADIVFAERAEAVLRAALAEPGDADGDWRRESRSLLALALVAQRKWDDAAVVLEQFAAAPPAEWLPLAERLAARAANAGATDRVAIADLQRRLLGFAAPQAEKLSAAQRREVDLLSVRMLADNGQLPQAIALAQRLAGERPDDGAVQELFAEILSRGGDAERRRALFQWREVQRNSRPGAARWFRAGYGLAHTQYLLNNKLAAAGAVKVIAAAYPELGGPEMKARFEKLRADCESAAK